VLTQQVGVKLLANPVPRRHQRNANFRTSETYDLNIGYKDCRFCPISICQRDHDAGKRRVGMPDGLQQHHRDKVVDRPIMGQLRAQKPCGGERRKRGYV
jgi:hypothetical protein